MTSGLIGIDHQGDLLWTSWINSSAEIRVKEYHDIEAFYKDFEQNDLNSVEVFVTEESGEIIDRFRSLRSSLKICVIPRVTAIYFSFRERVANNPCLVLSIGQDSTELGYFREGRLEIRRELAALSLRECWRRFVANNDSVKREIDRMEPTYPPIKDDCFKDFQNALKGSQSERRGPIYWLEAYYPTAYMDAVKEALQLGSGELELSKQLILSNWSALGNLQESLEKEGYVVHSSFSDFSFQDAIRGLGLYALGQQGQVGVATGPEGTEPPQKPEGADGRRPDEVFIECTSCGQKNRIPQHRSKRRPVCGTCKKPLPPILFQEGKDALSRGEFNKAIKCFEELLQEDKSNRLFQALSLLANIKHYKSIQGYEKKIAEVREWDELTQDEKPWVKEILTLAGKEYLEKGDIEPASENLEVAYQIEPSGEVAVLLGRIKQAKGDLALRKGYLQQAQFLYQEATIKDPANQDYPRYLSQVTELIESQRAKKRRMVWGTTLILIPILVIGIWLVRNVFSPMPVKIASSRVDADKQELKVNERVKLRFIGKYSDGSEAEVTKTVEWQSSDVSVATVSQEGEVKGLKVGRADITAHYGGLVSPPLSLLITDERPPEEVASPGDSLKTKEEPGTAVVVSQKIEDHIKVARWERDSGRYADAIAELEKARSLDASNTEVLRELEITRKAQDAEKNILGDGVVGEKSLPEAKQTESAETWSYEAVRFTSIFERPSISARRVAIIIKGTRVTVVRSVGDWLEVRSKDGNPAGFIRRDDAKYLGRAN